MAALWVAATAIAIFTSFAQAGRDVSSRFRVRLTFFFPKPKNLPSQLVGFYPTFCRRPAQVWTLLLHTPSWAPSNWVMLAKLWRVARLLQFPWSVRRGLETNTRDFSRSFVSHTASF